MAEDWTREEVEIIVAEYFEMLEKEQAGIPYSKTETRQGILPLLKNRSNGSVEFKHRNISAVLARMGQPYIRGYLPAYNYQKVLLQDVVVTHLRRKPEIEDAFRRFAEVAPTPHEPVFETMEETMPAKKMVLQEPELIYRCPVKINYIELEQANRVIGTTGESIALAYEKWRLIQAGKENLADKIEWVSQTQGDGLGFDILSRNTNGTDRYIEVKSTKLTKEAPFYFSALEHDFSRRNRSNFFLYRVFNLKAEPSYLLQMAPMMSFVMRARRISKVRFDEKPSSVCDIAKKALYPVNRKCYPCHPVLKKILTPKRSLNRKISL